MLKASMPLLRKTSFSEKHYLETGKALLGIFTRVSTFQIPSSAFYKFIPCPGNVAYCPEKQDNQKGAETSSDEKE